MQECLQKYGHAASLVTCPTNNTTFLSMRVQMTSTKCSSFVWKVDIGFHFDFTAQLRSKWVREWVVLFRCWIRLINVFKMGLETGLGCTYYYCRSSIGAHWSRSGNTIMWTSGAAISSLISAAPVPSIFPFTMAIQQTNNSNNIICINNNVIYCINFKQGITCILCSETTYLVV